MANEQVWLLLYVFLIKYHRSYIFCMRIRGMARPQNHICRIFPACSQGKSDSVILPFERPKIVSLVKLPVTSCLLPRQVALYGTRVKPPLRQRVGHPDLLVRGEHFLSDNSLLISGFHAKVPCSINHENLENGHPEASH